MATPPSGWKSTGTSVYQSEAITTVKDTAGNNQKLVYESNSADGSYTVSKQSSDGTKTPLYTQGSGTTTRTILNQAEYSKFSSQTINAIDQAVRQSSYELNQSVGTAEQKQTVNNSPAYQSLANASTSAGPNESNAYSGYAATDADMSTGIASKYTSKTYLQYPLNMGISHDKIKFTAVEIEKSAISGITTGASGAASLSSFKPPKNSFKKVDKSIFLGIQGPIQDQNTVSWGEGTLNAVEAFLFNTARGLMNTNADVGQGLENAMKQLYEAGRTGGGEVGDYLAGQAAGVTNILARTKGKILNPNLELLFQGPQLRPFNFQFKLNARTPEEAEAIKFIIKYFKRHMAVRRDTSALFLKAPHVFTIQYIKGGYDELHPSINLISPEIDGPNTKACALQACTVDYAPLGTYMTLNDESFTMVSYTMSLQFQEIEPVYDTDYTKATVGSKHLIGF